VRCPNSSLRPRRDGGESQCAQSLCDWARCYTSGVLSCCLRSALVPPLGWGRSRQGPRSGDSRPSTKVGSFLVGFFFLVSGGGCCYSAVVLIVLVLLLAEASAW
jgi:hypothetical protein